MRKSTGQGKKDKDEEVQTFAVFVRVEQAEERRYLLLHGGRVQLGNHHVHELLEIQPAIA